MTVGYSKLIIHDIVRPDVGASAMQARFENTTLTINPGMGRNAHEFTQLLEEAGFRVTGIWSLPNKHGVVESEVAV